MVYYWVDLVCVVLSSLSLASVYDPVVSMGIQFELKSLLSSSTMWFVAHPALLSFSLSFPFCADDVPEY